MQENPENATDIALFPIPSCVAFPRTIFPLHVFEPRYRAMVKQCIDSNMLMGISHTQKVLSPSKEHQSLEEALKSNQATYKPYSVFSAGRCELLETLEDGRLRISVHMEDRFVLGTQTQTLPYSIYACQRLSDIPMTEAQEAQAKLTQEKLLTRLTVITNDVPAVQGLLLSDTWKNKNAHDFSFELFGILRLAPEIQQEILELQSPLLRLEKTLDFLNNTSR